MANDQNSSAGGFQRFVNLPTTGYSEPDTDNLLNYTKESVALEISQAKEATEKYKNANKLIPHLEALAEQQIEFTKKLKSLRKKLLRKEIGKRAYEAEMRVALQAFGVALDAIVGKESKGSRQVASRANELKARAQQAAGVR
jgi:hypothetical protein